MKFRGLYRYMIQDLLLLTIIGGVLELFAIKFATIAINGTPFVCVSLLIVFIAVARWNWWGMLIAPIMALTAFFGGKMSSASHYALVYDWQMYVATTASLLTIGLNVPLFKKLTTKKVVTSPLILSIVMLVDFALVCGVQWVVYRLCCSGTLLNSGEIIYYYDHVENGIKTRVSENLCRYGESTFIYNLLGLAVLIIGVFILRSQGIVCDRKQKFVEDKINADLDRADLNFTIEEAEEEPISGEIDSSKKTDE